MTNTWLHTWSSFSIKRLRLKNRTLRLSSSCLPKMADVLQLKLVLFWFLLFFCLFFYVCFIDEFCGVCLSWVFFFFKSISFPSLCWTKLRDLFFFKEKEKGNWCSFVCVLCLVPENTVTVTVTMKPKNCAIRSGDVAMLSQTKKIRLGAQTNPATPGWETMCLFCCCFFFFVKYILENTWVLLWLELNLFKFELGDAPCFRNTDPTDRK